MSLRSDYDVWHQRVFDAEPQHDDASSPWYRLVREQMMEAKGARVLEVACGRGGFVLEMAQTGARVTGCDFSLAALQVGKSKRKESTDPGSTWFVQGDAQKLPFADDTFDLLVSCETIEHVPDVRAALREMWRVVRPQGKLFLTTPNYANLMGLYDMYSRVRHPGREDDQPFDRRQWFMQIRGYVRGAGWHILRSDGTVHQLPIVPGHNPIHLPILERNRIVRKLLSPFASHYFLLAEKEARS
jgi:2-polyprenyl-3-methyl-5-hydroxy-6-metoxy-1,4-benzoquinol methylase